MLPVARKYGIKAQRGQIVGLEQAIRKMDALPEAIRKGTEIGIRRVMDNVLTRAKANAASVDPLLINALAVEMKVDGKRIEGHVYVDTGPYGDVPMPVFLEMGTGPKGIESSGGPNGEKYPLPSSAYTQEPWFFWDETGEYTSSGEPGLVWSDGMRANPYLWPAIQAELPYAKRTIMDAIRSETRKMTGGAG